MTYKQLDNIHSILKKITESWFLTEPLFFSVFCTHNLCQNIQQTVPFRSGSAGEGGMRIEYNPEILRFLPASKVEELFESEVIRILLKHPYARKPEPFDWERAILSSNICILQDSSFDLDSLSLPPDLSYEQYYLLLKPEQVILETQKADIKIPCPTDSKGNLDSDRNTSPKSKSSPQEINHLANEVYGPAGLWEENDLAKEKLNELIRNMNGKNWGKKGSMFQEQIQASLTATIDYRKVLHGFRASILSDEKNLTRFKPSRRFGFDFMGSRRAFTTSLLIAVDTSGSINNKDLQNFFGVINKFFKYGIKQMDLVCFDTDIKISPISFHKAWKNFKVKGRGGTNFQCIFDYVSKHNYDGVILFTDGVAPEPVKRKTRTRYVWVLNTQHQWKQNHLILEKTGKTCFLKP